MKLIKNTSSAKNISNDHIANRVLFSPTHNKKSPQIPSEGHTILYKLLIIVVFIFAMQFCDSFCTELFSKLQSLYTTDFLIIGRGMTSQNALAYLSMVNFPFLIVSWLAPLGRILIDRWGRNLIYLLNICCMILGCIVCFFAPNLIIFLFGNAILTFSYSLDIQYIYIVDEVSPGHRATIRGITSGISALASILLPIARRLLITQLDLSWKYMYITTIGFCILLLLASLLLLRKLTGPQPTDCHTHSPAFTSTGKSSLLRRLMNFLVHLHTLSGFRQIALPLAFAGVATAGISFYNEPLLAFSSRNELTVDTILIIQPIVLLVMSVIYGFLADHGNRRLVLAICATVSGISLICFCVIAETGTGVLLPGICWGLMYSSYYSLVNLLQLMIIELAPSDATGKFSAASVVIYGLGDTIGLLLTSLLTGVLGMTVSKLVTALPFLLITLLLLLFYSPTPRSAPDTHPAC